MRVGQEFDLAFTWIVPETGKWSNLKVLRLRFRCKQNVVADLAWSVDDRIFSLRFGKRGRVEEARQGENAVLGGETLTFFAQTSEVEGGVEEGRGLSLRLPLVFERRAQRGKYTIDAIAENVTGSSQVEKHVATLTLKRRRLHR